MAKGLDVSEKRDLWVPAVLLLAGAGLAAYDIRSGALLGGLLALAIGVLGALACLPIRIRQGQARMVAFGAGVALVLIATVPAFAPHAIAALAWVVAGLAFLLPVADIGIRTRVSLLGGAAAFALLGLVAFLELLPSGLTWLFLAVAFHLAAQVWSSRPRREPAPPPGPRVCVMGGSFDPFHRGHRALAESALRVVDRLLVVPAGQAPHKQDGPPQSDFHHRVAMARLGVEGLPRTEVLELEGRRPGPSYTIETLEVVKQTHPEGTRLLLLVGADMYQDFPTWHAWEEILDTATLLVARRPGWDVDPPPEFENRGVAVEMLEAPQVDVSSTRLRLMFRDGASIGDLVSPAVQAYVRDHRLYEDEGPAATSA